jgi:hypothetical protein
VERGDEALMSLTLRKQTVIAASTAVIARLDRATRYAVTPAVLQTSLEYWITRFRG